MFLDTWEYKVDKYKESKIKQVVENALADMFTLNKKYYIRYELFKNWVTLRKNEWWEIKSSINFFKRMCKTHSSYVVKERPNIQVPPEHADVLQSKQLASYKERVLNLWWDSNKFTVKLKRMVLRWSIFGDQYILLSYNNKKEYVDIHILDPMEIYYETVDWNIDWDYKYVIRCSLFDLDYLKQKYPKYEDKIKASSDDVYLSKIKWFLESWFNSFNKALVVYYIDKKYIYTLLNWQYLVDIQEHWYDFIPLIHYRYIDTWEKYWDSIIDDVYEPIRYYHLSTSYMLTNLARFANAPLVTNTNLENFESWLKKWIIAWENLDVKYLDPPRSPVDLDKILQLWKLNMHFISGLSEEAMAWFTWALTAAWVAIELRLDATVREALSCQIVLKEVLEKMNRIWLRIMEKYMKNKNLLNSPEYWEVDHSNLLTWSMINWNYYNIVDFWWVLPRADAQIVQSVLSKMKMWLISKDTALEELRYADPALELNKIRKETIDEYKLQKALQSWDTSIWWVSWPKEENYIMIVEWQAVNVSPEDNHIEHITEHKKAFDKTQNQLLLAHITEHQYFLNQGYWWPMSQETQNINDVSEQQLQQQWENINQQQLQQPSIPPQW